MSDNYLSYKRLQKKSQIIHYFIGIFTSIPSTTTTMSTERSRPISVSNTSTTSTGTTTTTSGAVTTATNNDNDGNDNILPTTSSSIVASTSTSTSTPTLTQRDEIKQGRKIKKNRSSIPISASLSISNTTTTIQEHVKLISSDGFEFLIEKDAAFVSPTMKNMLSGQFIEAQQNTIHFPEINERDIRDIPPFDIDPYMALELLMVADFLQC
ncbi:15020_t:CDS:2 [Entrophospora sp. SA101]|nr:15020_t:CDS:2 [Entrophospora sp. SA101]